MLVQEFGDDFGPECVGDASVVFAPALRFFVGIGPKEIAEKTLVGNVYGEFLVEIKEEYHLLGA